MLINDSDQAPNKTSNDMTSISLICAILTTLYSKFLVRYTNAPTT